MHDNLLSRTIASVSKLDAETMRLARKRLDSLTKPQGSLGKLERMVERLAGITGHVCPEFADKRVIIFAADHGVAKEGVSAFPQEVTAQMVQNFLTGKAAVNCFAATAKAAVVCVDVGVAADLSRAKGLVSRKIAYGTGNMALEQAMSKAQTIQALEAGIEVATEQIAAGARLLATGEMGIGNTTASSAVLAALAGCSAEDVVGKGTGIAESRVRHKVAVIERALALHRPDADNPLEVLEKVGGLEIAAIAGFVLGCAAQRVPVVIDGFISTVAALCATRLCPLAANYLLASHLSEEPGHRLALNMMGLKPGLHMDMRLGEGTGAVLMFPLIDAACHMMQHMATFAEASVAERCENS
ncbi:MAG TPA: nicotinate-nucleotide--dimethylbenzimidazole phosphoribosyltransferase [Bacilli bacterium]